MSVATELLAELRQQGLTLSAMAGTLKVSPRSRLTPALRDAIVLHKVELTALLAAEATPAHEPQTLPAPTLPAIGPAPTPAGTIEALSIDQDTELAFRALSLPDCPDCDQIMRRTNVVQSYGRAYVCTNRTCGERRRVIWVPDADGLAASLVREVG